jgi:hypothetical protein
LPLVPLGQQPLSISLSKAASKQSIYLCFSPTKGTTNPAALLCSSRRSNGAVVVSFDPSTTSHNPLSPSDVFLSSLHFPQIEQQSTAAG